MGGLGWDLARAGGSGSAGQQSFRALLDLPVGTRVRDPVGDTVAGEGELAGIPATGVLIETTPHTVEGYARLVVDSGSPVPPPFARLRLSSRLEIHRRGETGEVASGRVHLCTPGCVGLCRSELNDDGPCGYKPERAGAYFPGYASSPLSASPAARKVGDQ